MWRDRLEGSGLCAGKWASYAAPPDLPYDQREEDGGSLVFETGRLHEPMHILGRPTAHLRLSVDRPVAMVAVRLSDVRPDGAATRVTYGLLNLTHRDGDADPKPLQPGEWYDIAVPLNGLGQEIPRAIGCACRCPRRTGHSHGRRRTT